MARTRTRAAAECLLTLVRWGSRRGARHRLRGVPAHPFHRGPGDRRVLKALCGMTDVRGDKDGRALSADRPLSASVLAERMAAALLHHEPGWRLPRHTALARRYNVTIAEIDAAIELLVGPAPAVPAAGRPGLPGQPGRIPAGPGRAARVRLPGRPDGRRADLQEPDRLPPPRRRGRGRRPRHRAGPGTCSPCAACGRWAASPPCSPPATCRRRWKGWSRISPRRPRRPGRPRGRPSVRVPGRARAARAVGGPHAAAGGGRARRHRHRPVRGASRPCAGPRALPSSSR